MTDINRYLLNKKEILVDEVAYYEMDFFDPQSGEVIKVRAKISDEIRWVSPRPVPEDAQQIVEAKIKEQTKVTSETGNIGALQNDL